MIPGCHPKTCCQTGRLAKVSAELDHLDLRVTLENLTKYLVRAIGRTVIDEYELVRPVPVQTSDCLTQLGVQLRQAANLVTQWNDNAQGERCPAMAGDDCFAGRPDR